MNNNECRLAEFHKPCLIQLTMQRKKNSINALVHRALCICSKSMLRQELDNITILLRDNNYPESIIDRGISNKLTRFQSGLEVSRSVSVSRQKHLPVDQLLSGVVRFKLGKCNVIILLTVHIQVQ